MLRRMAAFCFWLLVVIDVTVGLATLGFLITPMLSRAATPTNAPLGTWSAWLAIDVGVVAGAFALRAHGRTGLAISLLLILAIPAVYGMIIVGLMLLLFGVAGVPVAPRAPL